MKAKKKVVLAMSGGVDSSVAGLLLKKQGYEVHGFFMSCQGEKKHWPSGIDWGREEKDVKSVCRILGIKDLFVLNCEEGYEKKVISRMFEDYSQGLTPNPDILCNNVGKFPGLLKRADEIRAEFIATGHYARVRKGKQAFELLAGADKKKDQSYFLCGLGQEYLSRLIFPVGNLTKEDVRNIAYKNDFSNWDKRGSRGVCYLGKIDFKKFLHERIKEQKGDVISPSEEVIGSHQGNMFFTVGERVGEKNGFVIDFKWRKKNPGKIYIARKLKNNKLMVAPLGHEVLKTREVLIECFKLINENEKVFGNKFKARIRHLGELHSGKLLDNGKVRKFIFDKGVEDVAEGQFIVLYSRGRVVGGGEIRL